MSTSSFSLCWSFINSLSQHNRYITRSHNAVYLVDFATYKAPDSWKISHEQFMSLMRMKGVFDDQSMGFMEKILQNSGMGECVYCYYCYYYCCCCYC